MFPAVFCLPDNQILILIKDLPVYLAFIYELSFVDIFFYKQFTYSFMILKASVCQRQQSYTGYKGKNNN